jgi:hypothetical protein
MVVLVVTQCEPQGLVRHTDWVLYSVTILTGSYIIIQASHGLNACQQQLSDAMKQHAVEDWDTIRQWAAELQQIAASNTLFCWINEYNVMKH